MANQFVQVAVDGTGKKMQTFDNLISGNQVNAQGVALVDSAGIESTPYQTLFYDAWSTTLDTTDKWTVTGNAPSISGGNMTMSATPSSYNAIRSKDTIRANAGFALVRNGIALSASVITGCGRFWGLGTTATTPAAAVLAQDGIGFELDQATGALYAVTYTAGARTIVATLTKPTDGLNHAYGIYFRVTSAVWVMDGVNVATIAWPNVTVPELPALIVRQNAASFGGGTPVFTNTAHLTADTSRTGVVLADPVIGTRQARVTSDGLLHVAMRGLPQADATGSITNATTPVGGTTDWGTAGSITVALFGTHAGVTVSFQASPDAGTTWIPVQGQRTDSGIAESASGVLPANTARAWNFSLLGFNRFRVQPTAWTSGSASIMIDAGTLPFIPVVSAVTQTPPRQSVSLTLTNTAPPTTEALLVPIKTTAGVAATAANTQPVAAGKTWRISSVTLSVRATAATTPWGRLTVRMNPTGAATLTSPVLLSVDVGGTAAVIGNTASVSVPIPDGLELTGLNQLSLTYAGNVNTNIANISLLGYEF